MLFLLRSEQSEPNVTLSRSDGFSQVLGEGSSESIGTTPQTSTKRSRSLSSPNYGLPTLPLESQALPARVVSFQSTLPVQNMTLTDLGF